MAPTIGVTGLGALVAIVALAGCGSSEVDDYRENANAICATAHERMGKTPRPSSPARIAEVAKREIAVRGAALTDLSEMTVPMHISGATAVIDDLEARQERARAVEKAAEEKDRAKLRELEDKGKEELGLESARARELGLRDCAEL